MQTKIVSWCTALSGDNKGKAAKVGAAAFNGQYLASMIVNDLIGAGGVGLILAAYFLNAFGWMPQNRSYFALNTIGAAASCLASWLIHYWPFVVLEGTWTVVSVVGFFRAGRKAAADAR
jgi:hypothetical protein